MSGYTTAATALVASLAGAGLGYEASKFAKKTYQYANTNLPTDYDYLTTPASVGIQFGKSGNAAFKKDAKDTFLYAQPNLPLAVSNHTNKAYAFDHGAYEPIGQNHELKASTGKFSVFA